MSDFWIFMLIISLITPLLLCIFGWIFSVRPPKKIRSYFGYRTINSMKNNETWQHAHRYIGHLWVIIGLSWILPTVGFMLLMLDLETNRIAILSSVMIGIQLLTLFYSIYLTEKSLKKL